MKTEKTVSKKEALTKMQNQLNKKGIEAPKKERKFVIVTHGVEFWNPEKKGDVIEGELIEFMDFKAGKFWKKDGGVLNKEGEKVSRKAVIKTDDDKQMALPDTAILTRFLTGVEIGKYIRITYLGKELKQGQKKGGQTVHKYTTEKEA